MFLFSSQLSVAHANDIKKSIIKCADRTFNAEEYFHNWNDDGFREEWLKIYKTFDDRKYFIYYLEALEKCEARRTQAPTIFDLRYE
tara:strand:- start:45 stop:302 length:258 start_codon:yes stop_codon:yes gene_type:complete